MAKPGRFELVLAAFAATLHCTAYAENIECFAAGECTQSLYIDQWSAADAQECLEICRDYDGCEFFTHYGDGDDICLGLANCVELDGSNCNECYSGNKTCPDLQCSVPGTCEGIMISLDTFPSENDCLESCKATDGCSWLTFDESDGGCVLLENCSNLGQNDCDTCWSSQAPCGEKEDTHSSNMTKVLVIGGYSGDDIFLNNVEVIDLSMETQNCDPVANYPFPVAYHVGTILEDLPTACGGYNYELDLVIDDCYHYFYEGDHWVLTEQSMLEARQFHKASMLDGTTWLITGGEDTLGDALDSTEVWKNGENKPGPVLPQPMKAHCQVTLDSSQVAILGGFSAEGYSKHFFLLNLEDEFWTFLPDVPVDLYNDPCGLIENSANGVELVVLGDYDDCYIFNFEELTWRKGPDIPVPDVFITAGSMLVQMEDSFYIMGGSGNGYYYDTIFKFDNENFEWILDSERLEMGRYGGVAIAVPDEMVNCN